MATTKTVTSGNFDFNVGRGQLGFSSFFTLTQPITVLWVDAFTNRPYRYFITPNGANTTIRLPNIGTGFNEAAIGHTFNIQNMSGVSTLTIQDAAGGSIAILATSSGITLVAGNGGAINYITDVTGGGGGGSTSLAQVVTVAKSGGNYTSVAAALASITDNMASKPYVIEIAPGVYNEPQLVMKRFVSITGASQYSVFLVPTNPNQDFMIAASNTVIEGFCLLNVTGAAALVIQDINNFVAVNFMTDFDQIGIKCLAPTAEVYDIFIRNWIYRAGVGSLYGLWIDGRAATSTQNIHVDIYTAEIQNNQNLTNGVRIEGPFASIDSDACLYEANGTGVGLFVDDGARFKSLSDAFASWNIGIHVADNGVAPDIQLSSILVNDSTTTDIDVLSTVCTGVITGVFRRDSLDISPLAPVSISFTDPVDPGATIIGALYIGNDIQNNENAVPLIKTTADLGVIDGGLLTNPSGRTINVSAGFGYLISSPFPTHTLRLIEWPNSAILAPADTTSYIYFTSASTLTTNPAEPDRLANIILGRVRAATTTIEFIDSSAIRVFHGLNTQVDLNRDVLGPRVASGLITSANGSRQLSVTNGRYYFGIRQFNPLGGAFPITYTEYYHAAGVFTFNTGVTVVDNTQYDNGTDLVSLTASYYTKHTLYVVGDGVNEKYLFVYGQDEYMALVDVQSAFLSVPPNYFDEGVMIIASIIVQQGNPAVVEIRDERPVIGGNPTGIGGTSDHGALLGLLDDDHPQYFLANGTRAMTGDLDMGTNDIINAGTYNSINLSLHGARHLPAGADPLTTAAPSINLTPNSTNAVGIANSFARSDHSHALTTAAPIANLTATTTNAAGTAASFSRSDHSHAINSGAPVATFTPDSTNSTGTATTFARSDHDHQFAIGAPTATFTPDSANGAGVAASFARSDHSHAFATGPPTTNLSASTSNATGAAASFSRSDHTHAITTGAPSANLSPTTVNGAGVASALSRADHSHGINTGAPTATFTPNSVNAEGVANSFARSDHSHQFDLGPPTTNLTAITTNAEGVATSFARSDHTHAITTGAPVADLTPTTTNATGTAASLARSDHSHALPTAAPLVNLSTVSTNATGTANTFARSDHSHAITFPVFGTEYFSASSTATTSTTTQFPTWTEKINATTSSVPAGTYRITYAIDWTMSATTRDILIEVLVDGSPLAQFRDRSEQTTGTGTGNEGLGVGTGNDRRYKCSGFFYTALGASTHAIIFRFAVNNTGSGTPTASVGNAYIDFFRTS
jgi:hypothetical protein